MSDNDVKDLAAKALEKMKQKTGHEEPVVDPANLAQMETEAVASLGKVTVAGQNESDEMKHLENKYGSADSVEIPDDGISDDTKITDDVLDQEEDDMDDLSPVVKPEEDMSHEVVPIDVSHIKGKLTLTFSGNEIAIEAENMSTVSNSRIQRGLQRVFKQMHAYRRLDERRAVLKKLEDGISGATGEVKDNLEKEAENIRAVIKTMEQQLNKPL